MRGYLVLAKRNQWQHTKQICDCQMKLIFESLDLQLLLVLIGSYLLDKIFQPTNMPELETSSFFTEN